jgi:C-terminal processing protease CtpA/Prc
MYLKRDKETHKLVITKIFPNSPAEKAGLVPGLVLNKINNALAETNGIKKISALLMGPIGSKVVLEIIDSNDVTNHLEVTREQFVNHSTR